MNNTLALFQQFGKLQKHTRPLLETNYVVTLSRVSSKRQFEENLSIENQNKYFEEHALRTGKIILASFGGTYESAKTDDRKEFKRMLEFIKKNNARSSKKISEIWVYMTDRFSRTGVNGMGVAEQLREKYGVALYALAQPTNVKDESGIFSQNIQFLVSNYENKLRRKRMIDGMTAKFEKGDWVTQVPQGYSVFKKDKVRKIVINEVGKKLRKAFLWKADGMKNEEIILGLRAMGVKMYKQQLTKIFKKPFYCGLINHGFLNGKIVEGNHEPLISPEIFLKVNGIHQCSGNYGVPHKKEREELPLKVFVKCDTCGEPLTGYTARKKTQERVLEFFYYKCRKNGCRLNKSAKELHQAFHEEIARYAIKPEYIMAVQYELETYYEDVTGDNVEQEAALRAQLTEIQKKIDNIEEKHYALDTMTREAFEKLFNKYNEEQYTVTKLLQDCQTSISNLSETIQEVLTFTSKLNVVWGSRNIKVKEDFQKLLFPKGIFYNRETRSFRTTEVNFIFQLIAGQAGNTGENEMGTEHHFDDQSPSAEEKGFEPLIGFHLYTLSRRASSTTPALLRTVELIIQGCKDNPLDNKSKKSSFYSPLYTIFMYSPPFRSSSSIWFSRFCRVSSRLALLIQWI